jgi:glycerol-3-phosphate acyltransferase PlsY
MIELALKCLASYLFGSLMGGLIVGRARGGVDIRELGSGNAGGTNALRTQGPAFALWVMVIDVGKGVLAAGWIAALALPGMEAAAGWRDWAAPACGLAVVIGHVYPVWYGFRGGKGVATLIGAVVGMDAWLLLPLLATWLVTVALSGYVSLASVVAALALPAFILWSGLEPQVPLLAFAVSIAMLVVYTHRGNIARLRGGLEPRARRMWLLGRIRG